MAAEDQAARAQATLADAQREAERHAAALEDLRRGAARVEARLQEALAEQRAAAAALDDARREADRLRSAECQVLRRPRR
jgi:hypothetical protein